MGNNLSLPVVKERPMARIRRKFGMMTRKDCINRLVNLTLVNEEVQLRKFAAKVKLTKEELKVYHEKIADILGEFCTDMPEVEFRDQPSPPEPEVIAVQSSPSSEDSSSLASSESSSSSQYCSGSSTDVDTGLSVNDDIYVDSGLSVSDGTDVDSVLYVSGYTDVDTGLSIKNDIINYQDPQMKSGLKMFNRLEYVTGLHYSIFGFLKKQRHAKTEADPVNRPNNSAPPVYGELRTPIWYYQDYYDTPRSATPPGPLGVDSAQSQQIDSAPSDYGEPTPLCVYQDYYEDVSKSATPPGLPGALTSTPRSTGQSELSSCMSQSTQSITKLTNPTRPLGVDSAMSDATFKQNGLQVHVCASPTYQSIDSNPVPKMQQAVNHDEMTILPKEHSPKEDHASPRRKSKSRILGKIGQGLLSRGKPKSNTKASAHEPGVTTRTAHDNVAKDISVATGDVKEECHDKDEIRNAKKEKKKKKGILRTLVDKIKRRTESAKSSHNVIQVKPATPDCAVKNVTKKSVSAVPPVMEKVIAEEIQGPQRRIVWPSDSKSIARYQKVSEKKDVHIGSPVFSPGKKVNADIKAKVKCRRQSRGGC